ncbi:hypothetical protein NDU88_004685 [Pleurodeles waltl]|uniref:Uncharacterized protein n=1 Tax=Pleurodeles waltl TaxID=8319 RepID=A0AAV7M6Z9_PLEWA|nr:hypothetical protein NDU88_004685 [Pleurodeles waltl]
MGVSRGGLDAGSGAVGVEHLEFFYGVAVSGGVGGVRGRGTGAGFGLGTVGLTSGVPLRTAAIRKGRWEGEAAGRQGAVGKWGREGAGSRGSSGGNGRVGRAKNQLKKGTKDDKGKKRRGESQNQA